MLWELNWLKQRWTLSLDLFHSFCLAKPLARNKTILMFQWLPTLPWLIFNACENMISDGCLPQIAFVSASKASEPQKEVNKLFKVLFSLSYLKFCPKSMVWTSDKLVPFWFVLALSKMSTWVLTSHRRLGKVKGTSFFSTLHPWVKFAGRVVSLIQVIQPRDGGREWYFQFSHDWQIS